MNDPDLPRIASDPTALEAFYREHVEGVQQSVVHRVDDPYLAADLTADVFLAAVDAAPTYQPERGVPRAWLFGIARHVIAAGHPGPGVSGGRPPGSRGSRLLDADDIERMAARIDVAARARELFAAVARLPSGERAVFELVALDELTVAEAAAVLGIRPVAARVRLHRARVALRCRIAVNDAPALSQPVEAS
jgi:RNA polymerase sigma factor (sigma-70 family)